MYYDTYICISADASTKLLTLYFRFTQLTICVQHSFTSYLFNPDHSLNSDTFPFIAAVIYFLIFATVAAQRKKSDQNKWIGVLYAFLSIPLAPLVPLGIGILLLVKNQSEGMINLVQLCGLVEASFEASLQIIWQGYIICSDQLPFDYKKEITFSGNIVCEV